MFELLDAGRHRGLNNIDALGAIDSPSETCTMTISPALYRALAKPSDATSSHRRRHGIGFWVVAFVLMTSMAFAAAPAPL